MNTQNMKIALYLSIRILLMIVFQGITYLFLLGRVDAFEISGYYWATHISFVNLILLLIMILCFKKTGSNYFSFFKNISKKNSILFLKLLLPLVIIAMLPNILLSLLLYQDPQIGTTFLLGDIPFWLIVINMIVFPILQGLVELPFYFMFVMPMLEKKHLSKWLYIGLPVFFLSIQHAFMPFRFDLLYIFYRSLMFLPFALFIGLLIHKKPTLIPYLVILHTLMNTSLFMMYFIK